MLYQNETIMKSAVFTSAWKMFRELGITFSSALKLSWANAMSDKLSIEKDIAEAITNLMPFATEHDFKVKVTKVAKPTLTIGELEEIGQM